jgi:hypothetical protein
MPWDALMLGLWLFSIIGLQWAVDRRDDVDNS